MIRMDIVLNVLILIFGDLFVNFRVRKIKEAILKLYRKIIVKLFRRIYVLKNA